MSWVTLEQFVDRVGTLNRRARMSGASALGDMYRYVDGMSWLNRLWLRLQIQIYYDGEERDGYKSIFAMHKGMKKVIQGGGDSDEA